MYQNIVSLTSHIVPFMAVMGQVVTIWGFLNFMNQLSLQNLTLVADRALSRLPKFKNEIFILKNCHDNDFESMDEAIDHIGEIIKRLYMDLKQLGIAKNYDMPKRIALLSDQNQDRNQVRVAYLQYECGSDWDVAYKTSITMKIPFAQKLEEQLLNIFDLSHQGQTFMNHLSTNVIRIAWVSFIVYLLELQALGMALFVILIGVLFIKMRENNFRMFV